MSGTRTEQVILDLLHRRDPGKTICPSEAAKALAEDWRPRMDEVRRAAQRLIDAGAIVATQHGQVIDPASARGPVRLRLR